MVRRRAAGRAERRARARAHEEIVRDLARLARLEPGGSSDRPLPIVSPAQVEVIARAKPCPLCGGTMQLESHEAQVASGRRLRVARMRCAACGAPRALYFTLTPPLPH